MFTAIAGKVTLFRQLVFERRLQKIGSNIHIIGSKTLVETINQNEFLKSQKQCDLGMHNIFQWRLVINSKSNVEKIMLSFIMLIKTVSRHILVRRFQEIHNTNAIQCFTFLWHRMWMY